MTQSRPRASNRLLCLFVMLLVAGVVSTSRPVSGGAQSGQNPAVSEEIFVASNGWHSAIFVARSHIPQGAIAVASDFPQALYLGFGWGDAAYFPDRDPGISTLLSAAFLPTPSVIHVTGLSSHPRDAFPRDDVIGLTLSAKGFDRLLGFIDATFSRAATGKIAAAASGLHAYSRFYRARGEFHLFNNCNSWTARALVAGGVPMQADGIIRAEDLMDSLRSIQK